jgi:hypothetical protein
MSRFQLQQQQQVSAVIADMQAVSECCDNALATLGRLATAQDTGNTTACEQEGQRLSGQALALSCAMWDCTRRNTHDFTVMQRSVVERLRGRQRSPALAPWCRILEQAMRGENVAVSPLFLDLQRQLPSNRAPRQEVSRQQVSQLLGAQHQYYAEQETMMANPRHTMEDFELKQQHPEVPQQGFVFLRRHPPLRENFLSAYAGADAATKQTLLQALQASCRGNNTNHVESTLRRMFC